MKMAQVISNRTKFPIYYVIGIERLAGQNRIIVTGLPVVATRGGGIKTVGHPTARKPCQDYQYTLGMDSWKYDCILKEAGGLLDYFTFHYSQLCMNMNTDTHTIFTYTNCDIHKHKHKHKHKLNNSNN